MDNVSTAFLQEHPNVELITDGIWYDTTSELVGAMLTRSFQGDIFALNTMAKDYHFIQAWMLFGLVLKQHYLRSHRTDASRHCAAGNV